jgi:hypothetical protein
LDDNKLLKIVAYTAASFYGGPAGVAALEKAQGKDWSDALTSGLKVYAGGQIASGIAGSEAVVNSLGQTGANIAGKVVASTATGGDPLTALATAGLGQSVGEAAGLTGSAATALGTSVVRGVVAELQGKDVTDAMLIGAVSGYLSGEKDLKLAQQAADADIAGGMIPEYGTNDAYDSFMKDAMTPEAITAIENNIVGASQGPDNIDVGGGWSPAQDAATGGYDATEFQGSGVKDADQMDSSADGSLKDALKTGLKAGLATTAAVGLGSAVSSMNKPTLELLPTPSTDLGDIYKDAPIKGYRMVQDPATGRYIPYIGDRALLAKGGLATRKSKANTAGLASRR